MAGGQAGGRATGEQADGRAANGGWQRVDGGWRMMGSRQRTADEGRQITNGQEADGGRGRRPGGRRAASRQWVSREVVGE